MIEALTSQRPWLIAFTFGLLHGFGFAGALSEIGLPQAAIPLALACFNVGVELGQLAFVAVILILIRALRLRPEWPLAVRKMPAYAIGAVTHRCAVSSIVARWRDAVSDSASIDEERCGHAECISSVTSPVRIRTSAVRFGAQSFLARRAPILSN